MASALPDLATRFEPKLWTVLRAGVSRGQLARDVLAGVMFGVVALPLAIAFAIGSGVRPEQGLATAIVAGFLISALGGSRVQIGGPTGAFVVIVYGVVERHGYEGLAVATLLAGLLLIAMGVARLGTVIQFVPYPVTVVFTSGTVLLIARGQPRALLVLDLAPVPAHFLDQLAAYATHLGSLNPAALAIGAIAVATTVLWPRVTPRVPGSLVAIALATLLVKGL